MNEYDQQAADFLAKHGITFAAKLSNTKVPSWKDVTVNHFIVTFKKAGKKVSFDFFDSVNNFQKGVVELRPYDALTCCSSELYCPDTYEEFCSEYGYESHDKGNKKVFAALKKMSNKLQKFFDSEEMREDLGEIR